MHNPIDDAGLFIINTLFDIYIFLLMVRLILALLRVNYFNPVTQFIIKGTQPIIGPLRRIIPNFKNLEVSTLVLMIFLELLKYVLMILLMHIKPKPEGIVLLASADLLRALFNLYFYAILIQAIMSWVQQGFSPVNELLIKITAPIMQPLHRVIPLLGGIDITPVFALIILQVLIILLVNPIYAMGEAIALSY
jgi:YggT family protein